MRERTLDGYWWLPGAEDTKIAGVITFDGGKPTLRLLGAFTHTVERRPPYSVESIRMAPVILGDCDGKRLTLLHVEEDTLTGPSGLPAVWRQTLTARFMLVGVWLQRPDEEFFDEIVIGIDNLLAWSATSGIKAEGVEVDGRWVSTSVKWQRVEERTAQVGSATVALAVGFNFNQRFRAHRAEETLAETATFRVRVPGRVSVDTLVSDWTRSLQDLVTFAMDTPCALNEVTVVRSAAPPDGDELAPALEVELYFASLYRWKPNTETARSPLFTAEDVAFGDFLSAWFDVKDRLGPVVDMLIGQRYIERGFVENKLITAVAAVEGLHRCLLADVAYVDSEEFARLRACLDEAVPAQHRDWVRNRLRNEPSLRERLCQLTDRLGDELVLPFLPNPNLWAQRATVARNLLAHRFDGDDPADPDVGAEMYTLAEVTTAVITLVLMKEIGVPTSRMEQVVAGQRMFKWVTTVGPRYIPRIFQSPNGGRRVVLGVDREVVSGGCG